MVLQNKVFWQLIRFGLVGIAASCVHFGIVVAFVQTHRLQPLSANAIAFCFAFQVSYWGHRCFTFSSQANHFKAVSKLITVSVGTFAANQGLFYLLFKIVGLQYALALFIVLATLPILTFIINKYWVFR